MDDVLIRVSDKGDISVFDSRDDFTASFKGGHWINDLIFQFTELEEFTIVEEEQEVVRILNEARSALGKPLTEPSKP